MSPAGLFYGAAAFFVFRELLSGTRVSIAPALVLLVAIGWSVRFVGMQRCHGMARRRNDDTGLRQQACGIEQNVLRRGCGAHLTDSPNAPACVSMLRV